MTSDTASKPLSNNTPKMEAIKNSLVYANRRFHNNKLSCFLVTLTFVLVGCFMVMPPMLRATSSQMLDSYRSSTADLISRIREVVAAGGSPNSDKVLEKELLHLEDMVQDGGKGKRGKKNKGKKRKMKQELALSRHPEEGQKENDANEDYGDISIKINKKGKKEIREKFERGEKNGTMVWEEKSDDDKEEREDAIQNDEGKIKKKIKLYRKDVAFELDEYWTAEDSEQERRLMAQRSSRIRSVCKQLKKQKNYWEVSQNLLQDWLIWDTDHQLVWCPIFKAASTTWVKNFLVLTDEGEMKGRIHSKTREAYPRPDDSGEIESILSGAMKLIIVRHPLDRILSAYRDKMRRRPSNRKPDNFVVIQKRISKNFEDPKLPDGMDDFEIRSEVEDVPTFNQFLLNVREDIQMYWNFQSKVHVNRHWRPFWATCSPCDVQYNTIAKVETLPKDSEFIVRDRGLDPSLLYSKSHSSKFDSFNSTKEATIAYYSRVPRSLLEDIVTLYKPDFDLFDYSPDYHLSLTIQGI